MTYENPRNQPGTRPEKIEVDGNSFEFTTGQRAGSAVYKGENAYLRIGDTEKILADLALHKEMESNGFPVAKVLAEGETDGQAYFIESSLGEKHFGKAFAEDAETGGVISNESFDGFLAVVENFARAQLRTRSGREDFGEFARGIHLEDLCKELPEYAERILAKFEDSKKTLAPFPFVITHGDFNPNNLYAKGVIDLEDSFRGPYGYDPITALTHINWFPDSRDYEYFARYHFSPEQKRRYLERIDAISEEANLPPLSRFESEFEFCRAVWLAGNNPNTPRLGKFRHDLFIDTFLA